MRKLIVAAMISLDGVMQAPGGPEEDTSGGFAYGGWVWPYADEREDEMGGVFKHPFDLVLGRRTCDIFAGYWPQCRRVRRTVASRTCSTAPPSRCHPPTRDARVAKQPRPGSGRHRRAARTQARRWPRPADAGQQRPGAPTAGHGPGRSAAPAGLSGPARPRQTPVRRPHAGVGVPARGVEDLVHRRVGHPLRPRGRGAYRVVRVMCLPSRPSPIGGQVF